MRHSLLFLLLVFWVCHAFFGFHVYGQQPLYQFGGAESDSWDAVASIPNTESAVFALGYQRETQIEDSVFFAPDRGLVLASMTETEVELWGNMYSRGNTQIHDIVPVGDSVFVFGNAFSYLVYRGDTLISNNGRNSAFVLCLDGRGMCCKCAFSIVAVRFWVNPPSGKTMRRSWSRFFRFETASSWINSYSLPKRRPPACFCTGHPNWS